MSQSEDPCLHDDAMPKGLLKIPSAIMRDQKGGPSMLSPQHSSQGIGRADEDGLLMFIPSFSHLDINRDPSIYRSASRTPTRTPTANASPALSASNTPRGGSFSGFMPAGSRHGSQPGSRPGSNMGSRSISPTDKDENLKSPHAIMMKNKLREMLLEESMKRPVASYPTTLPPVHEGLTGSGREVLDVISEKDHEDKSDAKRERSNSDEKQSAKFEATLHERRIVPEYVSDEEDGGKPFRRGTSKFNNDFGCK